MSAPTTMSDDVFLKMTDPERIEFIEAFDAMEAAHALPNPSYQRAAAVQSALKRVDRVRRMMAAAKLRPMPPFDRCGDPT
jgi:hypothetical protein